MFLSILLLIQQTINCFEIQLCNILFIYGETESLNFFLCDCHSYLFLFLFRLDFMPDPNVAKAPSEQASSAPKKKPQEVEAAAAAVRMIMPGEQVRLWLMI